MPKKLSTNDKQTNTAAGAARKAKVKQNRSKFKSAANKPAYVLKYMSELVPREHIPVELPVGCRRDLGVKGLSPEYKKTFNLENHFDCAFAKWRFDHGFGPKQFPIPGDYDKPRNKPRNKKA